MTSINLTMISGGDHANIVPTSMKVSFDIRLSVDENHVDFANMVYTLNILFYVDI